MADLARLRDVEGALGRSLTSAERTRSKTLLSEATDLVVGYLGSVSEPVPEAVTRVVARMVSRVLGQTTEHGSEGTTETMGPFSKTVRFAAGTTSGQPWLGSTDKVILRPYRGGSGMRSVPLASEQTGRYRTRGAS